MFDRVAICGMSPELNIWTTDKCLVAPSAMRRKTGFDLACEKSARNGWPVSFRMTGGDITPQGPGVINVSVYCAELSGGDGSRIINAYKRFCRPIIRTLADFGCDGECGTLHNSFCNGAYNVNILGKKFSGTAQRRRYPTGDNPYYTVFFHALLLIEPPDRSAINSINQIYTDCGLKNQVEFDAHIGLTDLSDSLDRPITNSLFVKKLYHRYSEELAGNAD